MPVKEFSIPFKDIRLEGDLELPPEARGLVLFAHGSGSSRRSPRNQYVARVLRSAGLGTLLFDLLTAEEEQAEAATRHHRFNVPMLAERLLAATRWVLEANPAPARRLGYFGSSTGAAAALVAGAELSDALGAVVSRGGRADLAGEALDRVTAPTLLLVGGNDTPVIPLNREAYARLRCTKAMRIIPGASHLFEEAGALEKVAQMAADWFVQYLPEAPGCLTA